MNCAVSMAFWSATNTRPRGRIWMNVCVLTNYVFISIFCHWSVANVYTAVRRSSTSVLVWHGITFQRELLAGDPVDITLRWAIVAYEVVFVLKGKTNTYPNIQPCVLGNCRAALLDAVSVSFLVFFSCTFWCVIFGLGFARTFCGSGCCSFLFQCCALCWTWLPFRTS